MVNAKAFKIVSVKGYGLNSAFCFHLSHFFFPCSVIHSLILCTRQVSGIQQLNEWTDILSHIELHSASPDNNSCDLNLHITEGLKTNTDMAKV